MEKKSKKIRLVDVVRAMDKRLVKLTHYINAIARKRKNTARVHWNRLNSHGRRIDEIEEKLKSIMSIAYIPSILGTNIIHSQTTCYCTQCEEYKKRIKELESQIRIQTSQMTANTTMLDDDVQNHCHYAAAYIPMKKG